CHFFLGEQCHMLLLVDDDPKFLQQAERFLNFPRGIFFARTAEDAKSLLTTLGTEFLLMMIDLDLPNEEGFLLISEMRENFPGLPIIAISGVFQEEHLVERAKLLGAADT